MRLIAACISQRFAATSNDQREYFSKNVGGPGEARQVARISGADPWTDKSLRRCKHQNQKRLSPRSHSTFGFEKLNYVVATGKKFRKMLSHLKIHRKTKENFMHDIIQFLLYFVFFVVIFITSDLLNPLTTSHWQWRRHASCWDQSDYVSFGCFLLCITVKHVQNCFLSLMVLLLNLRLRRMDFPWLVLTCF